MSMSMCLAVLGTGGAVSKENVHTSSRVSTL